MTRRGAILAVQAIAEGIQAAGPLGAPSGPLYAVCMAFMTEAEYQALLASMKRAGLVKESPGHLLRWIGPSLPGR